jgi:hypothetical protein
MSGGATAAGLSPTVTIGRLFPPVRGFLDRFVRPG